MYISLLIRTDLLLPFFDTEKSVSLALISVVILFVIMHNIHPLDIVRCRFTSVSAVHRHIWCREIGAF